MSLAIQFIDQPQVQVIEDPERASLQAVPDEPVLREVEADPSMDNIALFEPATETRLRRANEHVAVLEAEIWALREALAGAERQVRHKELLLANARTREMELRAQITR